MARTTSGTGSVYRPKDRAVWWLSYYLHGRRVRESSGSTVKADALALLKQRLGEMGTGRYVGPEAERLTFEDLVDGVERAYLLAGRRSLKRVRQVRVHLAKTFAGWRALDITAAELERYALERAGVGTAAASIKYELAILRRGFSLAVKQGRLATRPAFPTIHIENARTGFFEPDEFKRVVRELPPPLRPLARFAYFTGWRSGEMRGLLWADVDWTAGTIRLDAARSKNGEGRVFPFRALPALAELLECQREHTKAVERRLGRIVPWVFHREGQPIRDCYAAWRSACARAKVPGRLMHDFRRTAVRNYERAGVPRSVAMQLTGHKTEAVYRRYAIVNERDLSEGVAKLAHVHESPAPQTVIPFPAAASG